MNLVSVYIYSIHGRSCHVVHAVIRPNDELVHAPEAWLKNSGPDARQPDVGRGRDSRITCWGRLPAHVASAAGRAAAGGS